MTTLMLILLMSIFVHYMHLGVFCMQINPDIREAHMLKGWFDNGGNAVETINLSGKGGPGGTGKHSFIYNKS